MTNDTCDKIRLFLVDYSDRVLPADHAAPIADHLAHCAACRAELDLLERSLGLAREVWQADISPLPFGESTRIEKSFVVPPLGGNFGLQPAKAGTTNRLCHKALAIGGGLAVCVAVLLLALVPGLYTKNQPADPAQNQVAANSAGMKTIPAQSEEEIDVMETIARESRSARLAASVKMLAAQPGLAEYKEKAERYLRENYADTTAVRMLDQQ